MAETFKCPSCSAPLEFEGKPMQKCRFCGCNVIVPSGVIQSSNVFGGVGNIDFGDLSALTGKALKIGEIQKLIRSGNKINAIKIFRETFGTGLKEAKDAVDAMEAGRGIDISGMQVIQASPVKTQSNDQSIIEIQRLLQRGNKIEAIKVFREMTGAGLKEAKEAVEAIGRGEKVDISQMKQNAAALLSYQNSERNTAAVKKIAYTAGGSILGTIIITLLLIGGSIVGVFYLVTRSVNKALDRSLPVKSSPNTPGKSPENSIAQELLKFGGDGTGAGKFKDNRSIAVDPDGKIYSADYSGGRVQIFDANGNFQMQILSDTSRTVNALATDRKGNLFILQGYDIFRFNKETGENLGKYRVDSASDLSIGLDGKLYVPNRSGEITVLSADGAKLKSIQISKDLNLTDIEQIAVDATGNFFLLDGKDYAIFKLSPDGKLLTRFGGRSNEPVEKMPKQMFYGTPYDMAIDSQGRLFVSQNSRISIFDSNGNFMTDFKTTQTFGIAFNDKDELFIASRPFVIKYKVNF